MIPAPTIPTRLTVIKPSSMQCTEGVRLPTGIWPRPARLRVGSERNEMAATHRGTLALLGGGEWQAPCRPLDEELLAASGGSEVVLLAAAAAFEHPERAIER